MSLLTRCDSERAGSESEDFSEDSEDTKGAAGPPSKSFSARCQSKSLESSDAVESLGAGASGELGADGAATWVGIGESCGTSIGDAALGPPAAPRVAARPAVRVPWS